MKDAKEAVAAGVGYQVLTKGAVKNVDTLSS
jgi:hypothetical protein